MASTLVIGAERRESLRYARTLLDGQDGVQVLSPEPGERLAHALIMSRTPVLVDSIDAWVAGTMAASGSGVEALDDRLDELVTLWLGLPVDVVAVTRDPGWLGADATPDDVHLHRAVSVVNRRLGRASSRVHLLMAGRVVDLSDAPRVP